MRNLVFILCLITLLLLAVAGQADSSLILHYSFDKEAGKTVRDLSGNGFDGEISGSPERVSGRFSEGLRFDGMSNEFVQIKKILPIGSTDNTIATWVRIPRDAKGRVGILLGNYSSSPNSNWELYSRGKVRVYWNGGSPDRTSSVELSDDRWHHVAIVRDKSSSTFTVYIDGKADSKFSAPAGSDITFKTMHRIGGDNRGSVSPWLQATIDEFMIFSRALSAGEIRELASD